MKRIHNVMRKVVRKFRVMVLFTVGAFIRRFWKRQYSVNNEGKQLIHVGCGEFDDSRYINVDTRSGWHIHHVAHLENMHQLFPAQFADMIYGCHVLEHVSHQKIADVLCSLFTCLKVGGILRLSVPSFEIITAMYAERKELADIIEPLMGGQGYPGNVHLSVFDEKYLSSLLLEVGFTAVKKWDPKYAEYYSFEDWASRPYVLYGKEWPISLNIEAVR